MNFKQCMIFYLFFKEPRFMMHHHFELLQVGVNGDGAGIALPVDGEISGSKNLPLSKYFYFFK